MAANYGASALGFIFYEKSPRAISIENAKSISKQLSYSVGRVGVFVNQNKDFIDKTISEVQLNMIQLHGDESSNFCNQFEGRLWDLFFCQQMNILAVCIKI